MSSSLDASVVPESSAAGADIISSSSSCLIRPCKGTIDLFSISAPPAQLPVPPQLMALDREARVLRYREKRKTRRFDKTIRLIHSFLTN